MTPTHSLVLSSISLLCTAWICGAQWASLIRRVAELDAASYCAHERARWHTFRVVRVGRITISARSRTGQAREVVALALDDELSLVHCRRGLCRHECQAGLAWPRCGTSDALSINQ